MEYYLGLYWYCPDSRLSLRGEHNPLPGLTIIISFKPGDPNLTILSRIFADFSFNALTHKEYVENLIVVVEYIPVVVSLSKPVLREVVDMRLD